MRYHRLRFSRRRFLSTIGAAGVGAAVWSIMPAIEQSSIQLASAARSRRLIAMENARKGTRDWHSPEIARYRRSSHDREIPPKWRGRGPGDFRSATQAGEVSETGGTTASGGRASFLQVSAQAQSQQNSCTPNAISGFADAAPYLWRITAAVHQPLAGRPTRSRWPI